MKKISSVIAGMLLMLCTICISPVYATDYYMGQYSNGNHTWLMSDSIKIGNYQNFEVTIKSVRNNEVRNYIHYVFSSGVGPNGYIETFSSSDGRSGEINASGLNQWSPVEHNIYSHYQTVWSAHITRH